MKGEVMNDMHASLQYQVMPPLTAEEYEALKADIAKHGVLVPVEVDEHGNVLDGHHRVRACQELGIKEWPIIIRTGLTEEQKRQHARRLNLARRHLSQEQKRALIRQQLKETPETSDRQIATALGVSNSTVSTIRKALELVGEVCDSHTSRGADGKTYSRRHQRKQDTEEIAALNVPFQRFEHTQEQALRNGELSLLAAVEETQKMTEALAEVRARCDEEFAIMWQYLAAADVSRAQLVRIRARCLAWQNFWAERHLRQGRLLVFLEPVFKAVEYRREELSKASPAEEELTL